MKKSLFLIPIAAIALASCSSDSEQQAVSLNDSAVKIFPQVGGATRGTIETTANISSFQLIANGKFATKAAPTDEEKAALISSEYIKTVNKVNGAWVFSDASKLYWGDNITTATFSAYANIIGENAKYAGGILTDVEIPTDVTKQKDLVVAYNTGTKTDFVTGVPIHFQHALSQIIVNAKYTYDSEFATTHPDLVVKVKGVKFAKLANKGNLTLPTASTVTGYTAQWALNDAQNTTYESTLATPQTLSATTALVDNSAAAGPMLLLPQSQAATTTLESAEDADGSYLLVDVDIDYKEAQTVTGTSYKAFDLYPAPGNLSANQDAGTGTFGTIAVPVNIVWKAGYKYIYTLNFSNTACGKTFPGGEPIVQEVLTPVSFLVTVESEWTEQSVTPAM